MSTTEMKSSLEIAQEATLRPIMDIAREMGLEEDEVDLYGRYKAKVDLSVIDRMKDAKDAKIVCVSAITPTKAGEGKTTTSVSLTQGLGHIGKRPVLCLREPSLGPIFGIKGGAAGGGYTQVVPMEDLNLHFTGDFHAVAAANNMLAAFVDRHMFYGNELRIDPHRVTWRRALDMNDRHLRNIVSGLGGPTHGLPRETGFDIVAASEIMAIMGMATSLSDLRRRIGAITVGYDQDGSPVTAEQMGCAGAMTVLLKDALKPNLIQTLEGQPCFMHIGPFGNIAHGNSSIVADLVGRKVGDYLITEAGFGSDLGMEKFMDIVCRAGGFAPSAVVIVATAKALKHHAGQFEATGAEGLRAIEEGAKNLERHIQNARTFGVPCVVAANRFPTDTDDEVALVQKLAMDYGAHAAVLNEGFSDGGAGAAEMAEAVADACEQPSNFAFVYEDSDPIDVKIEKIATRIYQAEGVDFLPAARQKIEQFTRDGLSGLSICMAKTHLSLSADPALANAPTGYRIPVRDIRPYTGAGFLTALCGDIMQMPGLGKTPAGFNVDIDENGKTVGLF
jgi:formate--tetrahydrofolate ligase